MKYTLLCILLFCAACSVARGKRPTQAPTVTPAPTATPASPEDIDSLGFNCTEVSDISDGVKRCENSEVVCYIYDGYYAAGMSCRFKADQ